MPQLSVIVPTFNAIGNVVELRNRVAAAIRRETNSWRWPLFTFGYMTVLAWGVAVAIYQIGSAFGYGR